MEKENYWHDELVKHLEAKEWSNVQITNLAMKIGRHATLSCQSALGLLEYVSFVDERIEAEKKYDEVFADAPVFNKEQAQQMIEYTLFDHEGEALPPRFADAGWDDNGNYTTFIPGTEI
jgi:hypothetical protein